MTDTTRELIQRLANALHDAAEDIGCWGSYASGYFQEKHDLPGNIAKIHAQAEEARAYLAQPEPKDPTDEELKQWYSDCADETIIGNAEHYWAFEVPVDFDLVRAVLARWGSALPTS